MGVNQGGKAGTGGQGAGATRRCLWGGGEGEFKGESLGQGDRGRGGGDRGGGAGGGGELSWRSQGGRGKRWRCF